MRKFERTKKLLSVLLAVVMVLSYVPVRAMAEECSHHSHDENCGYKEAKEGSACTHQHTESCTEEVTTCIHVHSEEAGCVLTPAAEAVACDHDCANGDCGYVAAQEAVPCTCGAQPQHDAVCASVTTEGAECNCTTTLTHGEGCEPKEAVEGAPCDHTHGNCAYREAVEESWSCDHACAKDNGCITVKENCSHVCPADDCGFVEAVEASPCTFVCEECLNEDVCPNCKSTGGAHGENCPKAVCPHCGNLNEAHSETCSTRCTNVEGCIDGNHGKDCPLYLCEVCGEKDCTCAQPDPVDEGNQITYFEGERTKDPSGGGGGNSDSSPFPATVNLEINGTLVTVGIAGVKGSPDYPDMELTSTGEGALPYNPLYPDEGFNMRLCVGAMVNFGEADKAVASQGIYNQILKDAEFRIHTLENHDGSDAKVSPNLKVSNPVEKTISNVKTQMITITAEPRKTGMCRIALIFKYGGKTYETFYTVIYEDNDVTVRVSENTNLAEILSNSQSLEKWLKKEHAGVLEAYNGEGTLYLNLPAGTYEDTLTVNINKQEFNAEKLRGGKIGIRGCTDGSGRTVMRKLILKQGASVVENIDFVKGSSGADVAIEHNNENREYHSTINSISKCSFQGYPVGVKDVGYGHIRNINKSLFYNCDTAVVIHPETTGESVKSDTIEYYGNTFMNSDTAISLESLPDGVTAYDTRFKDNTFLFNNLDFKMVPTGTFYFLRNYFGGKARGYEAYEDWKNPSDNEDQVIRHHAKIREEHKSDTKTVTNPVRKSIETRCDFWIYTGEDQHAAIYNSEAGSMLVDGDSFNNSAAVASNDGASGAEIPVSIMDNSGTEIAKWTF